MMESLVELYISSYSASWVYQSRGMVIAPAPSAEDRTLTIVEIISRSSSFTRQEKGKFSNSPEHEIYTEPVVIDEHERFEDSPRRGYRCPVLVALRGTVEETWSGECSEEDMLEG